MMIFRFPSLPSPFLQRHCTALLFALIASMALLSPASSAAGQLVAKVDRTQVSLEETLKLTLRYNEQVMFGEPDISQLQTNFDVLGNHRSNQYRSVNGRAESWTQWSLTLAPKKEGKLLIPSFEYDGAFTEAIEITVKQAPSYKGSGTDKPVYIETDISKPKAFVQEQLLYTIRLFTSVDLSGLNREDFAIENALLKQVSENQFQRTVGGKPYGVIEITYAIFPQQSGTLTIPAHTWDVSVQNRQSYRRDPFLSRGGQRLRLRIDKRDIKVLPKPSNYSGDHWLPATGVKLGQSWSQDPNSFKVGEPITRTLSVTANGLMASQLPPLNIEPSTGVKYYPDQPQSEEALGLDGITTIKTESYAIVPNRPGRFTLPAVTLSWWDTQTNRMREASLPVQTIEVSGDMPQTENTQESVTETAIPSNSELTLPVSGASPLWVALCAVLALLSVAFACLWWKARSALQGQSGVAKDNTPPKEKISESRYYKTLRESIKQGNASHVRQALWQWGQSFSEHHQLSRTALSSLQELGQYSVDLQSAIAKLESQLYSEQPDSLNLSALAQAVDDLRKNPPASEGHSNNALPPLYHAR